MIKEFRFPTNVPIRFAPKSLEPKFQKYKAEDLLKTNIGCHLTIFHIKMPESKMLITDCKAKAYTPHPIYAIHMEAIPAGISDPNEIRVCCFILSLDVSIALGTIISDFNNNVSEETLKSGHRISESK